MFETEQELINIRRDIHRHPEMAFEEERTAALVANYLEKLGIPVQRGVAKTGVVGLISGSRPGKTLLLRADMDALPITELGDVPYKSLNQGVMHACGHDVHTTVLLGAAKLLEQNRDKFRGNVKLVFQPAEEATGGAEPMIDEGIMENPRVDAAMAYHIWDSIPAGAVMLKKGSVMASPDHFHIVITGKGGHGAAPEKCVNPLEIGARIVSRLHKLSQEGKVISICSFEGGTGENIIPDTALLKGTARTLDVETRQKAYEEICAVVNDTAAELGGSARVDYRFLYPPCVNNDDMVDRFSATARQALGDENVHFQHKPDMIGEDFAYFAQLVPSCFVKLGGAKAPLHTAAFDVDESAIGVGAELMYRFALDYLNSEN